MTKKEKDEKPRIETLEDAGFLFAFLLDKGIDFDRDMGLQDIEGGKLVWNAFAKHHIKADAITHIHNNVIEAYEMFDDYKYSAECFVAIMQLRRVVRTVCMEHGKTPVSEDKLYGFSEQDLQHPIGTQEATVLFPLVEMSVSQLALCGVEGYVQDGRGFVGLDMDVVRKAPKEVQQLTDLLLRIDFETNPNPTGHRYEAKNKTMAEAVTDVMQKVDGFDEEDLQDIDNDEDYDDSVVDW